MSETELDRFKPPPFYADLDDATKGFVRDVATRYRLTFQEVRQVTLIARDLQMWEEPALPDWWRRIADLAPRDRTGPQRKDFILRELHRQISQLRGNPKSYPAGGLTRPKRVPLSVVVDSSDKAVLGDCPVASERTLCCNLKTIDAVENCVFGCSYCTIQTFYDREAVLDGRFRDKLRALQLDPRRFYHVTSGQSSDSLVWGNKNGILDDLCDFAAKHPRVLLELKTKSSNVSYFLRRRVPRNVICSWSVNTDTIVANEEHFTASLSQRLAAARAVADRGVRVGFHFHPIVHYEGWDQEYSELVHRVRASFDPSEVVFVSFGSLTFIKPVLRAIRERGGASKILQMNMVPDPHGKLTYPDDLKLSLFRSVYAAFRPWQGRVFMYLCMERADFWDAVFGWRYASNEDFEADFCAKVAEKLAR